MSIFKWFFVDNEFNNVYDDRIISFSSNYENQDDSYLNYDEKSFKDIFQNKNISYLTEDGNKALSSFNSQNQNWDPPPISDSSISFVNSQKDAPKIIPNCMKSKTFGEKFNSQIPQREMDKKEKIFCIKKEKKKAVKRKIFDIKKEIKEIKIKHTKNKNDNIISKIKRALYNHFLIFINNKLKNSKNPKLNNLKLVKNGNSAIMFCKKEENLTLLKSTLKEILSNNISTKYRNKDSSHNRKAIKKIIHQNDEEINNILNIKFEELLEIYNLKNENKLFKDFIKIDVDIEMFKEKGEEDCYIEDYEYISKNLKETISSIHPRRKRKKKLWLIQLCSAFLII